MKFTTLPSFERHDQDTLFERDRRHVWHPCTYMVDLESTPPLLIQGAKGSYLYTDRGPIIDAISSWWCKSLGHGHPAIIDAIQNQLTSFEHVIGAGTTHPKIVALAEALTEISQLQHVFFASDGASAVEIAMKLALHAVRQQGREARTFATLKHGYHGETIATSILSGLASYSPSYTLTHLQTYQIECIPYVHTPDDLLFQCCDEIWPQVEQGLESRASELCAIIVEPIVQGAGGMRAYSADFLRKLANWAKTHKIYLIADEIMTGFGRTGAWLACHHAGIQPDLICLSKGLTSGTIPLSCVLVDDPIYQWFYHGPDQGPSFLHSHTYSGHALGISAALATIETMRQEEINARAETLGQWMLTYFKAIASQTGMTNVRSIGAWVAGDLPPHPDPRIGARLHQKARDHGALLRPLGQTLYWLPPLTTDQDTIEKLAEITLDTIKALF